MPPRGKSARSEPRGQNRFASASHFEALSVDQLPSDTEESSKPTPEPSTPRTRSVTKRASKAKTTKTPPVPAPQAEPQAVLKHRNKDEAKVTAQVEAATAPAFPEGARAQQAATPAASDKSQAEKQKADASKAFWKKVQERFVFGLLMIGGFLSMYLDSRSPASHGPLVPHPSGFGS